MATNYEKYFGTPEKTVESVSHSTCVLDAALESTKVVDCKTCEGSPAWSNRCIKKQIEWLQEECAE